MGGLHTSTQGTKNVLLSNEGPSSGAGFAGLQTSVLPNRQGNGEDVRSWTNFPLREMVE